MLTTRPRLAPSRTAGLTDRYKRAWALHMKKYGRFGRYVDPVELEKRLKAARKHLSKWGCCRGSEWTDEELADQKLKAGKRGRKYLKLYGYARGTKVAPKKLKKQKEAAAKNLNLYGYARGTKVAPKKLKKQKEAAAKRLKEHGYYSGTKVAPEEIKRRKEALSKRGRKLLKKYGREGTNKRVAAAQAKGAYPTTPHVGVNWDKKAPANKEWRAILVLPRVDGKDQTRIDCGGHPEADQGAAAIEARREEFGLPPGWKELPWAKQIKLIRVANKKVKENKAELVAEKLAAKSVIPDCPTSSHFGVTWSTGWQIGGWVARVVPGTGKKAIYLGRYAYADHDQAVAAVEAKRAELGMPPAKKRRTTA